METPLTLTAKEAAAELGVSLPTLYAYVSRGLIRSEPRAGGRTRLYRAEDVRTLLARRDKPDGEAKPLDWGAPVLESAITLVPGDGLYYRGRDATRLAASASLETVSALLWDSQGDPFAEPPPDIPGGFAAVRGALGPLEPVDRLQVLLPLAAAADLRAMNRTADGLARTGARILRWVVAILADADPSALPLHQVLARAWGLPDGDAGLLRAALVLCADHELNASTFTVRCVASTGASPYACVLAGIAALRGPRHGGMTARVAALLPGLLAAPDPAAAFAALLARGEELPGFGHPLYPAGDVRAKALLRLLAAARPKDPMVRKAQALAAAAAEIAGQPPTIDFALALLANRLGLPPSAPLGLFTLGRTAGWVAHLLEQARSPALIRPRARYVGLRP